MQRKIACGLLKGAVSRNKIQTVGTATKLNETVLNRLQEGIIILLPQQIQKEVRIDNCGF